MLGGKTNEQWIAQYASSHQHPINRTCHTFGIPTIVVSVALALAGVFYHPLWKWAIGLFLFGWALQFIGHAFERKEPEFFHDWRFLLVGVRWWVVGTSPTVVRNFSLVSETKNGILILTCAGRLTAEVSQQFKDKVKPLLTPTGRVILDMGGITHVDSSGLGAVVGLYASARSMGCEFQICSLTEPVKRIFGLTKVLGAFESCGSYLTKMP